MIIALPAAAGNGLYVGTGLLVDHYAGLGPLYAVPAVNAKIGYNFGFAALECNFMEDTHDDKIFNYGPGSRGFRGTTRLDGKTIDVQVPLARLDQEKRVYGLFGVGEYSLIGHDPETVMGVKYSGLGYSTGIGVEQYLSLHVAFNLAVIYRTVRFDKKESQGTTTTLSPKLSDDLLSFEFGFNYHF